MYSLWLLKELKVRGVILHYDYEPDGFCLSGSFSTQKEVLKKDKVRVLKRTLFMSHKYTYDFKIIWNPDYKGVLFSDISYLELTPFFIAQYIDNQWVSYLEVKGEWDFNNMTRLFILNQKWVFDKFEIYIQLFKPIDFFKRFFIPDRYKYTDETEKLRKLNFFALTFDKWYNLNFKISTDGSSEFGGSIL